MTCLLLFILMENASPIPVVEKESYEGILKKLGAKEKKSVEFDLEDQCKLLQLIKNLEARLTEIEEEIAEWKKPQTTAQPTTAEATTLAATTLAPTTTTIAPTTTVAPTTEGPCTAIGVSADIYSIPDSQMTTTSHYLSYYSYNGRLNGSSGWCAGSRDNPDDYLQIDMGAEYSVCAVATQGKSSGSYLTSYQLSFSTDGETWSTYQEDGQNKDFEANEDLNSIVHHSLITYEEARYVRFHPTSYSTWPCVRVEIYVIS